MKTLDEVIFEAPYSPTPWEADALRYLKEYRWVQENCADALAEKYPSENVPLTWDELKQMKGKPVWVESKRYGARWYLLENVSDNCLVCIGIYGERAPYYRDDDDWQAYRKERK